MQISYTDDKWKLQDYRIRIINKLNKEQVRNGTYKFIQVMDLDKLIKTTKNKYKLNTELDALIKINQELTLKEIEKAQQQQQQQRKHKYLKRTK